MTPDRHSAEIDLTRRLQ